MISSSLLADLLLNKWIIGAFGGLIALVYAYLKGKQNANKNNELEKAEAERALNSRLRAAEAKNQHLEKKGDQINGKISSADTIDSIISLWNEINAPKSGSGNAPKDTKGDGDPR